ncbi:MAG: hypothetical protein AB7T63_01475 [Planctomycetota bacterium]
MRHALPLLVSALVLGAIAWRTFQEPGRELARARIVRLARAGDAAAARHALERYESRYANTEDRWFAARLLLSWEDLGGAIERVFDDPAHAPDAAAARRFAREALLRVGWEGGDAARPTPNVDQVLTILIEARDDYAERIQDTRLAQDPVESIFTFWFETLRDATARPSERGREILRRRPEPDALAVAALGAARPGPATATPDEVKRLREVIDDAMWHDQRPLAWHLACIAYAKVGGEAGRERLANVLAAAGPHVHTDPRARVDQATLGSALLAGGDMTLLDRLIDAYLLGDEPKPTAFGAWVVDSIVSRHREGDAAAGNALERLWAQLGPEAHESRERIAFALGLEGEPLDRLPIPLDRLVEGLRAEGATLHGLVLADCLRLAARQPGALRDLLQTLRTVGRSRDQLLASGRGRLYVTALLTGLRGLLLFGDGAASA